MKDVTAVFAKALSLSADYQPKAIVSEIKALGIYCGEDPDTMDNWYLISRCSAEEVIYGYLCRRFPAALLFPECPEELLRILTSANVQMTEFAEPMCCEEAILKPYVPQRPVVDESFVDDGDFSFDDERFDLLLYRLGHGPNVYVDASDFLFRDIE